jgi:hypothetical protein
MTTENDSEGLRMTAQRAAPTARLQREHYPHRLSAGFGEKMNQITGFEKQGGLRQKVLNGPMIR